MAEYKPQAVKDVPAQAFIDAYAAHLKSTDKVLVVPMYSQGTKYRCSRNIARQQS